MNFQNNDILFCFQIIALFSELCLQSCKSVGKNDFGILVKLEFLECLDLYNTDVEDDQLYSIICKNRGLRHLNLGSNRNESIDHVMLAIAESCPHIEILNLYDQVNLTDVGIKHLCRCTNLREFDIRRW